ncbi:Tetratricopeptide TPR_1 repeat-containing protein [Oscillatoria nigro-viridis PCC 7112]|uniref:Tetratricopeptide TPR_1 repeat-containing protein n=1 Tax=Phormidium nigroviride PCC 7112 TaxID=179408 RepID=K9VJ48_9CYAN|nr:CHAT domain-containing protein [Oscillatoria nigro-viridis]AFZ08108.1 Tetratricopeptide TPR_1 repeat-containing protein [Oscillatoria nigro-viridis PCC 7112]
MLRVVNLDFGLGNLIEGFPYVTARLDIQKSNRKFQSSLGPAPRVKELYEKRKFIYEMLYSGRAEPRIEIVESGVNNFSDATLADIDGGLKENFNQWLSSSEFFNKIEKTLRTELHPSDRIQIFIESDNLDILLLPWESWQFYEDFPYCETIGSTLEYPNAAPKAVTGGLLRTSQLRILGVLGNSRGINVKKDEKQLRRQLGDRCYIKFLDEPEPEELNNNLVDEKGWQILFFAGHSDSDDNAQNGRLYINQKPYHNTITIADLKECLKKAIDRGLHLLIFNSCKSLALARDLAAEGVSLPPMIVMREPVPDKVAHEFLKFFLKYLIEGEILFVAVRKAKDELKRFEKSSGFPAGASGIPMLCQHPNFEAFTVLELERDRPVPADDAAGDRQNNQPLIIPIDWMQRAAKSLGITAISYMLMGPILGRVVNEIGKTSHHQGQLLIAERCYQLATLLNLNYATPHYNLAMLYDGLNEKDRAQKSMKDAARRGSAEANSQLSRSLILNNQPQEALKFIARCLEHTEYDGVKAACFKNRGWVRLAQKQYEAAEADLRIAIGFRGNSPEAQCLLAEVLEIKGKQQEALEAWNQALKYSDYRVPKQDECMRIAQQRLQAKGNIK